MEWQRDNISGFKLDSPWKWLLLPGVIAQWLMYMFPSGGYGQTRQVTRHARSPIMTLVYSAVFYLSILLMFLAVMANGHR